MDEPNLFESDDDDHYHNPNELKLWFKTVQGDSAVFTVTKDTNIGDFKKKYKKYNNLSECTKVVLCFRGKSLDPYKTFGYYNIGDEETIHVLQRLSGC